MSIKKWVEVWWLSEVEGMNWSKREIEVLEKLYPNSDITKNDILKVFPTRSWGAIMKKASEHGFKRGSMGGKIDEEYFKKLKEVVEF